MSCPVVPSPSGACPSSASRLLRVPMAFGCLLTIAWVPLTSFDILSWSYLQCPRCQRTISPFILWKVQDSNLRCPTLFIALPSIKPSATYPVCLRPLGQPSMISLILMSLIVSLSFESFKTCEPHGWQAILSNKINNSSLFNIVAAATQRFVNSCITYLYISLLF